MAAAQKKPATKYGFAPGSRLGNRKDAQKVGEALERISRGGQLRLTADVVLREAEDPRSVLHKFFEWNDREAARKYRLDQARLILRSVVVYHLDNKGQTTSRNHEWYSVREGGRVTYVKAEVVWQTPDLRQRVLEQARRDMQTWISRYEQYEFLAVATKRARKLITSTIDMAAAGRRGKEPTERFGPLRKGRSGLAAPGSVSKGAAR